MDHINNSNNNYTRYTNTSASSATTTQNVTLINPGTNNSTNYPTNNFSSNNLNNPYINNNVTRNRNPEPNNLAKELHILNVKSIFYTTLATDFINNNNFLEEIDHNYNTRRRAQGRFKVPRFYNEYGRNSFGRHSTNSSE